MVIAYPKNNVTNVPPTKNGPNGTCEFIFFFLRNMRTMPTTAPAKNAEYNAMRILGNPRKSPMKNASFTSPKPSQRPRESKKIAKKKAEAMQADASELNKGFKTPNPNGQ